MAVFGNFFGPFGVLLAGTGVIGVLVPFMGVGFFTQKFHLVVGVVACALLTVVYLSYSFGILGDQPLRTKSEPTGMIKIPQRGSVSMEQLRGGGYRGAVLSGVELDRLELAGAKLDGVVAPGASLVDTRLSRAQLAGADLRGADLRLARLHGADLRGANLVGANLRGTDLTETCLLGADLSGAVLDGANAKGAAVTGAVVTAEAVARVKDWPKGGQSATAACS